MFIGRLFFEQCCCSFLNLLPYFLSFQGECSDLDFDNPHASFFKLEGVSEETAEIAWQVLIVFSGSDVCLKAFDIHISKYGPVLYFAMLVLVFQTLIEANVAVKTSDGYLLRLFCIGFTKKSAGQLKKTSYAKSSKIRQIRAKMIEYMQKEVRLFYCFEPKSVFWKTDRVACFIL